MHASLSVVYYRGINADKGDLTSLTKLKCDVAAACTSYENMWSWILHVQNEYWILFGLLNFGNMNAFVKLI